MACKINKAKHKKMRQLPGQKLDTVPDQQLPHPGLYQVSSHYLQVQLSFADSAGMFPTLRNCKIKYHRKRKGKEACQLSFHWPCSPYIPSRHAEYDQRRCNQKGDVGENNRVINRKCLHSFYDHLLL